MEGGEGWNRVGWGRVGCGRMIRVIWYKTNSVAMPWQPTGRHDRMPNAFKSIGTDLGERVRERRLDREVDLDLLRLHQDIIRQQSSSCS